MLSLPIIGRCGLFELLPFRPLSLCMVKAKQMPPNQAQAVSTCGTITPVVSLPFGNTLLIPLIQYLPSRAPDELPHCEDLEGAIIHYRLKIEHHWRDKDNNEFPSGDKSPAAVLCSLSYIWFLLLNLALGK